VFYVTLYNENYAMPKRPAGVSDDDVLRGIYRFRAANSAPSRKGAGAKAVRLFGSGSILNEALRAQEILGEKFGVAADVYSVPGAQRLRADALAVERWNRLHPGEKQKKPLIAQATEDSKAPVIAVSDWVKTCQDMLAPWIAAPFTALGTDGFGRSDTRPALRRFFEVDAEHVVVAALSALCREGKVEAKVVAEAIADFGIDPDAGDPRDR
jgi:pyruvate dehydrogenase E1 component